MVQHGRFRTLVGCWTGAVKSDEGVLPDDGMLVFTGASWRVVASFLLVLLSIVFHVELMTSPGSVFSISAVILIQMTSFTHHCYQFFNGAVFPLV